MKNYVTAHASSKIQVRTGKYDFYYLAMLFLYQVVGDACFTNFTYSEVIPWILKFLQSQDSGILLALNIGLCFFNQTQFQ